MLDEKVCLVTGAAQGIGRATALEMARQGAGAVMICDVQDERGEETAELVAAEGAKAAYVHCDVADRAQIQAAIDATVDRFGGLDVLHNNAGIHESDLTEDLTIDTLPDEVWDRVYAINIRGMWQAIKYAAPHLRRSDRGPAIVNAASLASFAGYPMASAYCSTKGAVPAVDQDRRDRPGAGGQSELLLPRVDRHADGRQVLRGRRGPARPCSGRSPGPTCCLGSAVPRRSPRWCASWRRIPRRS